MPEAIEVLQIHATDKGRRLTFLGRHLASHRHGGGLTLFYHLDHVGRQLITHLFEGQYEGILVAITETAHRGDTMQHLTALSIVPNMTDGRMIGREGNEPVADIQEEGEAFHLLETLIIDVRALLLHISHASQTALHLLHITLRLLWMQDVLKGILVQLFDAFLRYLQLTAINQVGHNLVANRTLVVLGVLAVIHLHL